MNIAALFSSISRLRLFTSNGFDVTWLVKIFPRYDSTKKLPYPALVETSLCTMDCDGGETRRERAARAIAVTTGIN